MKDVFGNTKPVQIEVNEWWFNGRIIQKNEDFRLPEWISFADRDDYYEAERQISKKDWIAYAIKNPCREPRYTLKDYIGGN